MVIHVIYVICVILKFLLFEKKTMEKKRKEKKKWEKRMITNEATNVIAS